MTPSRRRLEKHAGDATATRSRLEKHAADAESPRKAQLARRRGLGDEPTPTIRAHHGAISRKTAFRAGYASENCFSRRLRCLRGGDTLRGEPASAQLKKLGYAVELARPRSARALRRSRNPGAQKEALERHFNPQRLYMMYCNVRRMSSFPLRTTRKVLYATFPSPALNVTSSGTPDKV